MKNWIIIVIVLVINLLGIIGVLWCDIASYNRIKNSLDEQTQKVEEVLQNLPPSVALSPTLNIEDKSSFKILGKGNSGTINAPTERIYILKVELDSSNIMIQAK